MSKQQQNHSSMKTKEKRRNRRVPQASADLSAREFIGKGQGRVLNTLVNIPRTCQFFPDRYRAWCTSETGASFSANTYTHTYIINDPLNDFGPRVNYTGSFGSNAPAGGAYLLSGLSDNNASAPYSQHIVIRYECEVQIASASAAANSIPFVAGITFTTNLTGTSAMTVTQLCEQPRTIYQTIPHLTSNRPIVIANSTDCASVAGITNAMYLNQPVNYGANTTSSPFLPIYAQVWFRPFDASTSGSYSFLIRHRFHIQFSKLNSFSTGVPSFKAPARQECKDQQRDRAPGWF